MTESGITVLSGAVTLTEYRLHNKTLRSFKSKIPQLAPERPTDHLW